MARAISAVPILVSTLILGACDTWPAGPERTGQTSSGEALGRLDPSISVRR